MEAINRFRDLFLEVWREGIFGLNASEIIIGIVIFLIFYVLRRLFARFIISRLNKLVNKLMLSGKFLVKILYDGDDNYSHIIVKSKSGKNQWLKLHIINVAVVRLPAAKAKK